MPNPQRGKDNSRIPKFGTSIAVFQPAFCFCIGFVLLSNSILSSLVTRAKTEGGGGEREKKCSRVATPAVPMFVRSSMDFKASLRLFSSPQMRGCHKILFQEGERVTHKEKKSVHPSSFSADQPKRSENFYSCSQEDRFTSASFGSRVERSN